jgi:hypothetical protein
MYQLCHECIISGIKTDYLITCACVYIFSIYKLQNTHPIMFILYHLIYYKTSTNNNLTLEMQYTRDFYSNIRVRMYLETTFSIQDDIINVQI